MAENPALLVCASPSVPFSCSEVISQPFSTAQHSAQTSLEHPKPSSDGNTAGTTSTQRRAWSSLPHSEVRHLYSSLRPHPATALLKSMPDNRFLASDVAFCAVTATTSHIETQFKRPCTFFTHRPLPVQDHPAESNKLVLPSREDAIKPSHDEPAVAIHSSSDLFLHILTDRLTSSFW